MQSNGAPKHVENDGSGSVTPRSVPANLEVSHSRNDTLLGLYLTLKSVE